MRGGRGMGKYIVGSTIQVASVSTTSAEQDFALNTFEETIKTRGEKTNVQFKLIFLKEC